MKRTQLYVEEEQFQLLRILAKNRRTTVSELMREAIRKCYFEKPQLDPLQVVEKTSGLWKDRTDLGTSEDYVRKVRKDRRLERIGKSGRDSGRQ